MSSAWDMAARNGAASFWMRFSNCLGRSPRRDQLAEISNLFNRPGSDRIGVLAGGNTFLAGHQGQRLATSPRHSGP